MKIGFVDLEISSVFLTIAACIFSLFVSFVCCRCCCCCCCYFDFRSISPYWISSSTFRKHVTYIFQEEHCVAFHSLHSLIFPLFGFAWFYWSSLSFCLEFRLMNGSMENEALTQPYVSINYFGIKWANGVCICVKTMMRWIALKFNYWLQLVVGDQRFQYFDLTRKQPAILQHCLYLKLLTFILHIRL